MDFVEIKSGTSVEGAEIKAYKTEKKSSSYIYIMAGAHGDEVEGVYVVDQLFKWLKQSEDIDLPLIIVPVQNVDGYRTGSRVNSHEVDLNRNFPSKNWKKDSKRGKDYHPGTKALSEPENQFLDKLFNKYPPKLILSFHSWKPMINFNGECKHIADYLAKYNNYEVVGDVGHETPGSLGEYAPEKYNCPVITFECPVLEGDLTLKSVWEENEEGLKSLMESNLLHDL